MQSAQESGIVIRTVTAIKTGTITTDTGKKVKYDYTALWAALGFIAPEAINGLVELANYVLSSNSGIEIPDNWKTPIRTVAFILAWFARSGLVRKPLAPAQDATPATPADEEPPR